jgi:hypothetical protein
LSHFGSIFTEKKAIAALSAKVLFSNAVVFPPAGNVTSAAETKVAEPRLAGGLAEALRAPEDVANGNDTDSDLEAAASPRAWTLALAMASGSGITTEAGPEVAGRKAEDEGAVLEPPEAVGKTSSPSRLALGKPDTPPGDRALENDGCTFALGS